MTAEEWELRRIDLVTHFQEIRRMGLVIEREINRNEAWRGRREAVRQAVRELNEALYRFDEDLRGVLFQCATYERLHS